MTKKEAINTINNLIKETTNTQYKTKAWVIKVRSIVIEIFGENSIERKSLVDCGQRDYVNEDVYYYNIAVCYANILPSFADTLLIKGNYKPLQGNMVSHLKNWQILGSIVIIFLAGFGTYRGLEEIVEENQLLLLLPT